MSETSALYRAIENLNKIAGGDEELKSLVNAIVCASRTDKITVSNTICRVDEDWVNAVERGLNFIGGAIKEERRFIRSDGDVLPIEKIKRVSKESVQHLARHSDLINSRKSDEEVVPDKLLTVERLNDYATYENRFLYTLLCMLKEFVAQKYTKILKSSVYSGGLNVHKTVRSGGRRLEIDVNINDVREGDELLNGNILRRIEQLQQTINFYLRTPLMIEVSKSDMVQSGVTKTNVLRMDKNFKEAVDLYEFLMSYDKDGFTSQSSGRVIDNGEELGRELAMPALMYAFLAYEHGLGLEKVFKDDYEKAERAKLDAQREAIKFNLSENGGAEKYILMLEKRNTELEIAAKQLCIAKEEIAKLNSRIQALSADCATQKSQITELNKILECGKSSEETHEFSKGDNQTLSSEFENLQAELIKTKQENVILEARLLALRGRSGLTEEDEFNSEQQFKALERDYETLGRMVRKNWKGVKKMLRREFFADLKSQLFVKKQSRAAKDGTNEK